MSERLTEFPDQHRWDLTGFTLDQIRLDYQVTLLLAQPHSSVTVVIETPFTLRVGPQTEHITPDMVLSTVPLLPLLHEPVASLTAFRNGQLLIAFEDGAEIDVRKDAQYESWNTFGDGETADVEMLCSGHDVAPWGGP